jgi:hypothetical protein
MQPTTASTEPRGESGGSKIRRKPPAAEVLCCRARRQRKGSRSKTKPQQTRRAVEKDAEAGRSDAAKKGLMDQVRDQ